MFSISSDGTRPASTDKHLYLRGAGFVAVVEPDGQNLSRFILPPQLSVAKTFEAGLLPDGTLAALYDLRDDRVPSGAAYFCILDEDGKVVTENTYDLPLSPPNVLRWSAFIPGLNPLTIGFQRAWTRLLEMEMNPREVLAADFFILLAAKLLACAIFVFIMLRRTGYPLYKQIGWAVFALLGGVPAVLTVWALFIHGQRARCPQCGGRRAVFTELCPLCAAPWPAPPQRESDLFITAPVQAQELR